MRFRFDYSSLAIGSLVLSLAVAGNLFANPTGEEPYRPLAAHGTIPQAKEMVASLYKLYEAEEKYVIENFENVKNPTKLSDREIAGSVGRLWKALRDAEHLQLMGEPAAYDLERKLTMLRVEVGKFALAYRGTPKGQQLIARIQKKLQREQPGLNRFLEQASDALQQGKLEIFEKQMEAKGIDLHEQLSFFTTAQQKPYITNFNRVLDEGDVKLSNKRRAEYMEMANEAVRAQVAAAVELPTAAQRIAGEIAASGSAKLGEEKTGDAAEALAHVVNLWGAASAGLIRANAIQWAFTGRAKTQIQPDSEQLKTQALRSIASIVEAAATSTPAQQVQPLYGRLLEQISVADRRVGPLSEDVYKACEAALGKLAAKDPALTERIQRYQRATAEPLRWRRMFAHQQTKNLEKLFPASNALLTADGNMEASVRPNYAIRTVRKGKVAPDTFSVSCSWMVQDAARQLVGKPVTETAMLRLSPTSRTAVVPHDSLHFANVTVPLPSEQEVGDLMQALVIDEQHGPLTRESADAVSAAQLHDYLAFGGRIERVHLEAVATRFASLPDIAYTLVPLGKMPELRLETSPIDQTCWRLDVKPMWAQHRYFTVRPGAKQTAAK